MKIDLLDIEEVIRVNKLEQITSPRLFSNKMIYDTNGILSNDIFGISKKDRRGTFAYIDLKYPFIHPHIYANVLKRMFRNVIYIVSGQRRYSIIDGQLKEDSENGWTGLAGLYDKWDDIDWSKLSSSNERSLKLLSNIGRDEAFIKKMLVCPPAYRDVMLAGSVDSSDHVNELNDLYVKLIRAIALLSEGGLFARTQYATQSKIQDILVNIFDYFKNQVSKKTGLIRKYLIGKSVDYGTRSVISAFNYNNETIKENMVDINHTAFPISQCCSTFYPFIEAWLQNFFTREIINDTSLVSFYDPDKKKEVPAVLKEPEMQFSEKVIRKMINDYCFNPDNRFKELKVKTIIPGPKTDKEINAIMLLKGKRILDNNIQTSLNRAITITDLLYLACVDVCEKRHIMVTRYPVGTDKGLFMSKIRVQSTIRHIHVLYNGKDYPYYPDIDFEVQHDRIGVQFIDTTIFSNSLLEGMGADYDGDQVSIRGIWTDEANDEANEIMNAKMSALNITGSNSRQVSKEILNSYYALTKIADSGKSINTTDTQDYLNTAPDGFTRSKIAKMLADTTASIDGENNTTRHKAKHNTWDRINVPSGYFYDGQPALVMTIGRFIFNQYVLAGAEVIHATKVSDIVLNKAGLKTLDTLIGQLYMENVITRQQFNSYIDRRDNLGYWLNGMLAHTISARMAKPLKEIEAKKREIYKKYEKELEANNIDAMNQIEKELITYAKEVLKDDPGMDLYLSGDLDFDNNYKNNAILKGPVMNKLTNEFDFVKTSYMNGMDVHDIPVHANGILAGQYPASIATKDSGYMGKKLLALLQMMEIDEPGTDCKTKNLIPITITNTNKNEVLYVYIEEGSQLKLITRENVSSYIGKTVKMRSPMTCISPKICSKCAGELFYMLGAKQAGLYAVQLSHSLLNLGLKAKHNSSVDRYHINTETVIEDI